MSPWLCLSGRGQYRFPQCSAAPAFNNSDGNLRIETNWIRLRAIRPGGRETDHPAPRENRGWSVYRLRGTPAAFLGIVYAPDEKTAIAKAIIEFKIDAAHRARLIARPGSG
jgi:hypothetical protein